GLKVASEKGEAAGEDAGLVTMATEGGNENLRAGSDGNAIEEFHDASFWEAAEERQAAGEALLKIEFAAHGCAGDAGDFVADTFHFGQLVDDFGLNEGGIHIEDDEAARAAEFRFRLNRDVDAEVVGELEKRRAKRLGITGDDGALHAFEPGAGRDGN